MKYFKVGTNLVQSTNLATDTQSHLNLKEIRILCIRYRGPQLVLIGSKVVLMQSLCLAWHRILGT